MGDVERGGEPKRGTPPRSGRRRARVRVTGVVQGVGFRPFAFRLASELGLVGFVLNDSEGVLLEIEGTASGVESFLDRLSSDAPPLATVDDIRVGELAPRNERAFRIVESDRTGPPSALVSPDTATCAACLDELFDPRDRRYRYPFINCTNCGPRLTIVRGIPYDRSRTTMAGFEMCSRCRTEYEDAADRRFHAQPVACPECGPAVRLLDPEGRVVDAPGPAAAPDAPVRTAARLLGEGAIVAVKGLGGYHLACVAGDEEAVIRLRDRKHRRDKPFALMAPDLETVRALVRLGAEEEELLLGRARPVVLAPRRSGAPVAESVASGHPDLGVMLPYTPLHHLLLNEAGTPLVMTSGNVSREPIAYRDEEALERLAGIADFFLVHDRPIHVRADDSVVRVVALPDGRRSMVLRRSRGFVPEPVALPVSAPAVLGCGGHLKNTFALAEGDRAWMGPHVGDLESYETLRSFRDGVRHFEELFSVRPGIVAHDHHPEYLSTKYAEERGLPSVSVQHHHAHLAACLAEHGRSGPALGAIFDGTGHGEGGSAWGGELLLGDLASYRRLGHLWPVRLPGGAAAIRQPWRMACAWLVELEGGVPPIPATLEGRVNETDWRNVARMSLDGTASPVTTSMGRLFDAVSALSGLRTETTYEGQAAVDLEAVADPTEDGAYPLPPTRSDAGLLVLDARKTVAAVLEDLEAGAEPGVISARFHAGVAGGTVAACRMLAGIHGVSSVVLSGGVFQNVVLLEATAGGLADAGLRPVVPRRVPPNDGGLSYGQCAVAAARFQGPDPA